MLKQDWRRLVSIVSLLLCSASVPGTGLAQVNKEKPALVKASGYKPALPSRKSKEGSKLFAEHNCSTCHSIGGSGGCLAPPLDGEGARRKREFLLDRITAGRQKAFEHDYPANELMPHPRLPVKDAQAIVAYLLTLPEPARGFAVFGHQSKMAAKPVPDHVAATDKTIAEGKSLYYQHGCAACHALGSMGGQLAPRLDGIAAVRRRDQVLGQITQAEFMTLGGDKEYQERGTIMPPSNLSADEIARITDFLMSVPRSK